ncbi:MAG: electron transport complex subunit E [Gammaproteobacteria bacterium]|nr:electron transport complex subunit E [Gammaproteobacteria bacterium]
MSEPSVAPGTSPGTSPETSIFSRAAITHNPAWVQLLGLCPLLAVSNNVVNALGLSLASTFVLIGSNCTISIIRSWIPGFARLPCFVLIIATFTTCTVLLLQAFAFDLYLRIALFVQIIVTNCMIVGRIEAFASKQPLPKTILDAAGTACGFAMALLALGAIRELIGHGTLFAGMELLFGPTAAGWQLTFNSSEQGLLIATLPPGAFIIAGLLLGFGNALLKKFRPPNASNLREPS